MKISFVLPVYNQQASVSRCIESLVKQSIKDKEIIVIDDGSTDNSGKLINYWHKKGKIRVIRHPERKGAAESRNEGNIMASGEIIAVCDCDLYYKDRGQAILEYFTEYPEKDIFYSALHLRDSKNPYEQYLMEAYEWDFRSKCPISHPTMAYRKEVVNNGIKPMDDIKYPEVSIETDLFEFFLLQAAKQGFKFGGCANPLMQKIEGNSNRKTEQAKMLKKNLYREWGINVDI